MTDKSTKTSAIIVAAMTSFIAPFMVSGVNIALPSIQKAFSVNAVLLGWVVNSTILASAVFLIPAGKVADIYGRKKTLIWGLVIFSLTGILCASAWSIESLIVFRIMQSVGAAFLLTSGLALVISVFPAHERGKALGITVAATYIGLSSGPFLGGLLTHYFTWRSVFVASIPFAAVCIFLAVMYVKGEWTGAAGEKIDITGSIIYGISLVLFMYGLTLLPDIKALLIILPGMAGLIVFVKHELRIKNPVFEMRLFKNNRVFTFSTIAALVSYAATFATAFLLSLYLQYITGLTPQSAGLVIAAQPVMQALISPFAGKLSDRVEPAVIASAGMAFTAVGLFLLILLNPGSPVIMIIGILLVLGFGFALFSSPNTNAIMSSVDQKYYGIASGSVSTVRGVGMSLSMTIVTVLFSIFIGKAEISPATYGAFVKSFKTAFTIFTVLCVIAVYFSFARGNLDRSGKHK